MQTAMSYEREVRREARLAVDAWLWGVDAKRLHFFHEVRTLGDGARSGLRGPEGKVLGIDCPARRSGSAGDTARLLSISEVGTGRHGGGAMTRDCSPFPSPFYTRSGVLMRLRIVVHNLPRRPETNS